ncbi:MAG: hypothetical protein JSR86_05330 [Proteobacteria bacterium]|nr:hypothetical protein [Pseudomonadota bacterium]
MRRLARRDLARLAGALFAGGALWGERTAAAPAVTRAALAGAYDGGQMEIAAGLELGADGRFRYALSYGALDEEARGRWEVDGDRVVLTSDPVTDPKFVLVAAKPLRARVVKLALDLPAGMERQYFDARIALSNGAAIERQFGEDGLEVPLAGAQQAVSVSVMLGVFELASPAFPLPRADGVEARLRFEPNDLGKVRFERQALAIEDGALVLARHGRRIVFRRQADR